MDFSLANRTALITGSSSGIGAGVARLFGAHGASVVVNYPTSGEKSTADAVVDSITECGGQAIAIQADVSSIDDVNAMVEETVDRYKRIDILVNNAGIASVAPVEELPVDDWDRLFSVHVRGMFLVTRKVLPLMYENDYGRIINTASQLAYKGAPGLSHYTAAKGAILSFTRSLALEVGTRNINVNAVAPGATLTPILDSVPADALEAIRLGIPKGRIADVDDIVPSYLFLASEEARHIQGQCISPNGGDVFL